MMKTKCNGYEIVRNDFWPKKWQVWHENLGFCHWFQTLADAIEYCQKG